MRKFNFKFVFRFLGILLLIESSFMFLTFFVSEYFKELSSSKAILISTGLTFLVGLMFFLFGKKANKFGNEITNREGFVSVTASWIALSVMGMLPYYVSGYVPNVIDAFFETMSGFTTTGSTILPDIEAIPKSLLFWRSFTQWIGGIGIIVFVITFIPFIGGSASSLFKAEVSGFLPNQMKPRASQIAKRLSITYLGISLVGFLLLWAGPMSMYDAACHIMTSISTGGFSTRQASVAAFNSAYVEYVLTFFMFIGGVNFSLIYLSIKRGTIRVFKDEEFKWYLWIAFSFTVIMTISLLLNNKMEGFEYTFRTVLFNVVSVMTTTGSVTIDYLAWGYPYWFVFIALMMFCASAGSTSGGMKISRLIILVKNSQLEFRRQVHPHAILNVWYNNMVIPTSVVSKILAFIFLYLTILGLSFLVLSISGMPFDESIGAALTSLSNVGPGMGASGPVGSFAHASGFAKIYLSFLMLIGRLEIFTILSLFVPSFWK